MPNEINIYDTRHMMAVVERRERPYTFLRDTFFTRREMSESDTVDIDVKKANRKVAPYVHTVKGGQIVPNSGFETMSFKPPLVAPLKLTTVDDLLHRMPGENLYSKLTPAQRAVKKMADDFNDLDDQDTRREEVMAAQAIFNGYIDVIGEGLQRRIDFNFDQKEVLTTKKWSDTANSLPLKDIAKWKRTVQKNGFVNCDICILGSTAAEYFLANETVMKQLDTKNIQLAVIDPKQLPSGATYLGYDKKENISYYTYNQYYQDDWTNPEVPKMVPFVPDNSCTLLSTEAQWTMAYAAITLINQQTGATVTYVADRVPDTFIKKQPDRRFFSLSSKPLPIPTEVNSWYVATVCDSEEA